MSGLGPTPAVRTHPPTQTTHKHFRYLCASDKGNAACATLCLLILMLFTAIYMQIYLYIYIYIQYTVTASGFRIGSQPQTKMHHKLWKCGGPITVLPLVCVDGAPAWTSVHASHPDNGHRRHPQAEAHKILNDPHTERAATITTGQDPRKNAVQTKAAAKSQTRIMSRAWRADTAAGPYCTSGIPDPLRATPRHNRSHKRRAVRPFAVSDSLPNKTGHRVKPPQCHSLPDAKPWPRRRGRCKWGAACSA